MPRSASLVLSLILLWPQRAAAQFASELPSFDFVREKTAALNASAFERAKYLVNSGPGQEHPDVPPHESLLMARLNALADLMHGIEEASGRTSLQFKHLQRLKQGVDYLDIYFVDPIAEERWDAIFSAMGGAAKNGYASRYRHDWDKTVDAMLKAGFAALKESHSAYLTSNEWKSFQDWASNADVAGIGAVVEGVPEGAKIRVVVPHAGAAAAGLMPGDVIVSADGASLAGKSRADIVQKLLGPAGTTVVLAVIRAGIPTPLRIKVSRSAFKTPTSFSKMLDGKVGYVYFAQFDLTTDDAVFERIRGLRAQGAKSLILDVRGNPGGVVGVVASIASEFLRNGEDIVSFSHQGLLSEDYRTDGDGEFSRLPVAVLVDGGSASASEILSGALQDHGYAVIGSQTYGKGTEQVVFGLPSGGFIITENRWYTPSNRNINGTLDADGREIPGTGGITPNSSVTVSEAQAAKIMQDLLDQLYEVPGSGSEPDPVLAEAQKRLSSR